MKVSIITSCFNREATIGQAIESVLSQDYPDVEYIVVDGASKDGSLQVINRYRDRIAKIISEPDKGMYEGINKGVQAATGDIIGLLHSDDFLFDRHVISDIVRKFSETGAELVYGNGLFVDFEHTDRPVRDWISGNYRKWKVKCGWLPLHPTVYIRREVMGRWGLYNENYKIAADTDLLVRYLYEADLRVEYLNKYIVRMRMGGLSTDSARRKQMWKEDVGIYKAHGFPGVPAKLMKMSWKVPQFIGARIKRIGAER
jgi:glycosyltransferase involved in cell wall biosynthesis